MRTRMRPEFKAFLDAYIEAALWSSTDPDTGRPLDEDHDASDLSPETRRAMVREAQQFIHAHRRDVEKFAAEYGWARAGHDFWLTRNRHGAGFWDEGAGALGDRLTRAAHAWGSSDLYVGDDGKVHGG